MDKLTKEQRHKCMSHIRSRDTGIELALRRTLWANGFRYRKNYKALPGTPDIALTREKIAIFCDSEFFHGKDWDVLRPRLLNGSNGEFWVKKISRNMERDYETDRKLLYLGWTVIHFWGTEILKQPQECLRVIREAIQDNTIFADDITIEDIV